MAVNPERVLEEPADRTALLKALVVLAGQVPTAAGRQALLTNAGVALPTLNTSDDPLSFASALVAQLRGRALTDQGADQHPLVRLLGSLLDLGPDSFGLNAEHAALFERLVAQARDQAGALRVRRSVGKIEDARGNGIGTGVVVAPGLLLTSAHLFTKMAVARAWARFDYTVGWDGRSVAPGTVYELDLQEIVSLGGGPQPDYALLRLVGAPARPPAAVSSAELNSGLTVRLIHHPRGEPAVVSGPGRVVQVGADYLLHDLPTDVGSSGAPIFDRAWELVALHRGVTPRVAPGTTEGVPLHAFWETIGPLLEP
jgi:hypothetical protein